MRLNYRIFYGEYYYIIKNKIHSSCEIEYFVETHLCKLCVILRSRVLLVVCLLVVTCNCPQRGRLY